MMLNALYQGFVQTVVLTVGGLYPVAVVLNSSMGAMMGVVWLYECIIMLTRPSLEEGVVVLLVFL